MQIQIKIYNKLNNIFKDRILDNMNKIYNFNNLMSNYRKNLYRFKILKVYQKTINI